MVFLSQDINEHIPVFSSTTYTHTILESLMVNAPTGLVVKATELGDVGLSHTITYAITSGNVGGAFAVNETSGVITLANPVDYETVTPDNNPVVFTVSIPCPGSFPPNFPPTNCV